jgi:carbon monoxide dehydrogenase subunit G
VTAIASIATPLRAADPAIANPAIVVRESQGVYSVVARFHVARPPEVALAVLTDYERIPRFMPGVETSVVIERAPGRAIVEQEATSRLMMFKKRVRLVLEIEEASDSLRFRDLCGQSFARYEGAWQLSEVSGGTDIVYDLTARPAFDVPEFLLKRLLNRDSGQMIDGLRREIERRSASSAAAQAAYNQEWW